MSAYSETGVCRRKFILNYFGEILEKDCGFCDNCKRERETFEGVNDLTTVLEAVKQTQGRFGIDHLVKVILGELDDYISSYQHDSLPVFGKGKGESERHWTSVIRQAMIAALLEKDIEKAVQQVEPNKSELTQEQMSHLFNMMTIFSILPQTESKNI